MAGTDEYDRFDLETGSAAYTKSQEQGFPVGDTWLMFSDLRMAVSYALGNNWIVEYHMALNATHEELSAWTRTARTENAERVSAADVDAAWNALDAHQLEEFMRNLVRVVRHPRHFRRSDCKVWIFIHFIAVIISVFFLRIVFSSLKHG